MAVVVSEEAEGEQKLDRLGLNTRPHRALMHKTWGDDHQTIEDRFGVPADKRRLVFVCAKWLTGFDAPTISTLYLDKPLQNHTLMQTIARANRVAASVQPFLTGWLGCGAGPAAAGADTRCCRLA